MKYGRNFIKGTMFAVALSGFFVALVPVSSAAAATNPQPSRCTTSSPDSYSWRTTRTYTLSQPWCIHYKAQGSYLVWQADGNFVWYTQYGIKAKSDTQAKTGSRGFGTYMVAQTDGNIVIQDAAHKPLWGLNYLNRGKYWVTGNAAAGDIFEVSLYQYTSGNQAYGDIEYYIYRSGNIRYSATIAG